ncbi:MAG: hypothetical protein WKG00_17540 [Polyangiaceae bacterium]
MDAPRLFAAALSLTALSCTLIGEGELDDKPSRSGSAASGAPSSESSASSTATSSASSGTGAGGAGNACAATPLAAAGSCPTTCTNVGSCTDASNTTCQLERTCADDCKDEDLGDLVCPDGLDCKIVCEGHHACHGDRIVCPAGRNCQVECNGEHACEEATIEGNGAAALTASCVGKDPCVNAAVGCGLGDCTIGCVEDACDGAVPMVTCPTTACTCSTPPPPSSSSSGESDGD